MIPLNFDRPKSPFLPASQWKSANLKVLFGHIIQYLILDQLILLTTLGTITFSTDDTEIMEYVHEYILTDNGQSAHSSVL